MKKIIAMQFPEEFQSIQTYEKDNTIYVNLEYSEPSSELLYTPQVPQ